MSKFTPSQESLCSLGPLCTPQQACCGIPDSTVHWFTWIVYTILILATLFSMPSQETQDQLLLGNLFGGSSRGCRYSNTPDGQGLSSVREGHPSLLSVLLQGDAHRAVREEGIHTTYRSAESTLVVNEVTEVLTISFSHP